MVELTLTDMFGDTLEASKSGRGHGVLLVNTGKEGNVDVSVWLSENQKWELIEFLSR